VASYPTIGKVPYRVLRAGRKEFVRVKLFFDDEDFDGQLLRAVSYTAYGGADIGECFETARRIKEGDRDSWYEAWTKTADRMKADAEESLKGGHRDSARRAYMLLVHRGSRARARLQLSGFRRPRPRGCAQAA
jgi:hypothetical protein